MNIWSMRERSIVWLKDELSEASELIQQGFEFHNRCIELLRRIGDSDGETPIGKFGRICTITLAKSCTLLLGCYSLCLDGLAQESGALFRPLIETYELLVYIRQDMSRVDEAIEGRLPTAGIIGKRISGDYQDLRDYLSKNSSHFNFQIGSVRHLFDGNVQVRPLPSYGLEVLKANLLVVNAFQIFTVFEAVNCLIAVDIDTSGLETLVDKWRKRSLTVFTNNNIEA